MAVDQRSTTNVCKIDKRSIVTATGLALRFDSVKVSYMTFPSKAPGHQLPTDAEQNTWIWLHDDTESEK